MKRTLLFSCFAFNLLFSFAQTPVKKEYTATRISSHPKIDGVLDDSCWINIPVATDFVQSDPNPGLSSRLKTEVKFVYDNSFIYISAMMYDTHPDSILRELSKRDNVFYGPNADAFGFFIDTYHDGQNALMFGVTSCGVQADTKVADPEEFDDSWNVAWESKVKITDNGWIAEIKIPYSAIRFSKKEIQEWGINFSRQIRRYREFSNWNPVDPEQQGFIRQSGILKGISNIESPLRLSFSPYISSALNNYDGSNSFSINGGADVKYGINESFTMDITLIPDFGQARSDDKVLNLSPFEVRYDEQRSFFTEGTELFNRANLFYSRRVGGMPIGYESIYDSLQMNEDVTDNPSSVQLYNATKISGRTKSKLGIGFFNAITAPAFATITDTISDNTRKILTQPLTNYNVFVLDQSLKNNSFISLINTNVAREGSVYDANVTGTQYKFADKSNRFAVMGGGSVSQLFHPDSSKPILGHRYRVVLAKISGNYTSELMYRNVSDKYDNNDLGYTGKNNEVEISFSNNYNIYKPFWIINKMENGFGINYFMLYKPRTYTNFNIGGKTNIDFKNYFTLGFFWKISPLKNYDYYEPRTEGRYYISPENYMIGTYFSSDSRKRFGFNGFIGYGKINERNRYDVEWGLSPSYRFSDKFNMNYNFWSGNNFDDVGYVRKMNDTIIFGVRNRNTRINTLEGNYIFTSTMSLSLRARHYWSQVKYKEYFALDDNGKSSRTSYIGNNDINFNAVTVDMIYTWQFAPASELSFVWKNAIFTSGSQLINNYFDNFNKTFESPQLNSFSIKILYYLDYQNLKRKK